jgi:hypothetical protein
MHVLTLVPPARCGPEPAFPNNALAEAFSLEDHMFDPRQTSPANSSEGRSRRDVVREESRPGV